MKACYTVIFVIQSASKQAITLYKCTNDMRITFCLSNVYIVLQRHADYFILLTAAANFCSTNMVNLAVDNGLMSCFTNNTCIAECYRGYIFPSGNTKESYSCQNGNLTPMLSTCKRKLQSVNNFIYLLPCIIIKSNYMWYVFRDSAQVSYSDYFCRAFVCLYVRLSVCKLFIC